MKTSILFPVLFTGAALLASCSAQKKLSTIISESRTASLELPLVENTVIDDPVDSILERGSAKGDPRIMNAMRDEATGEMVATERLRPAVLVSRFRNVAERLGRVDMDFLIIVSDSLQDPSWQLRFSPKLLIQEDTLELEPVFITGEDFRRAQMRGYDKYERYLRGLQRDSLLFVDESQVGCFMQRNDEIAENEVRDHYSRRLMKRYNARRNSRKESLRKRYIPTPIDPQWAKLDSLTRSSQPFVYMYKTDIDTRPGLKKATVLVEGEIFENGKRLCALPPSEPLTFYISSLSGFADPTPRYNTEVVERVVKNSISASLRFEAGKSEVDMTRVRERLDSVLGDPQLVLDSLIITASCSPEGAYGLNSALSLRRADAARHLLDETCIVRGIAENWDMLDSLVAADPSMRRGEKAAYKRIRAISDPDAREDELRREKFYPYLRAKHYPALRFVRFDSYLHRKDMEKDTIVTSVLDTVYMEGVRLLEDRAFEKALAILQPYGDINTAVAYLALEYNATAAQLLETLPLTAQREYLLALSCSRRENERSALEHYLKSVEMEPSYRYRGNLDPEIAAIIRKYSLFED